MLLTFSDVVSTYVVLTFRDITMTAEHVLTIRCCQKSAADVYLDKWGSLSGRKILFVLARKGLCSLQRLRSIMRWRFCMKNKHLRLYSCNE